VIDAPNSVLHETPKTIHRLRVNVAHHVHFLGVIDPLMQVPGFGQIPVATPFSRINIVEAFENRHEMVYGYRHEGERIELTALRLTIILPVAKLDLDALTCTDQTKPQTPDSRRVWFENEWFDTQIYRRESTPTDSILPGPAVIEEYDSTILIPPAWHCRSQSNGCLVLERKS